MVEDVGLGEPEKEREREREREAANLDYNPTRHLVVVNEYDHDR